MGWALLCGFVAGYATGYDVAAIRAGLSTLSADANGLPPAARVAAAAVGLVVLDHLVGWRKVWR